MRRPLTYNVKLAEMTDKRTKGDVRRARARLSKNCIFTRILILDRIVNAKSPYALKLKQARDKGANPPDIRAADPARSVKK